MGIQSFIHLKLVLEICDRLKIKYWDPKSTQYDNETIHGIEFEAWQQDCFKYHFEGEDIC